MVFSPAINLHGNAIHERKKSAQHTQHIILSITCNNKFGAAARFTTYARHITLAQKYSWEGQEPGVERGGENYTFIYIQLTAKREEEKGEGGRKKERGKREEGREGEREGIGWTKSPEP
jgi:hypothetical protein